MIFVPVIFLLVLIRIKNSARTLSYTSFQCAYFMLLEDDDTFVNTWKAMLGSQECLYHLALLKICLCMYVYVHSCRDKKEQKLLYRWQKVHSSEMSKRVCRPILIVA